MSDLLTLSGVHTHIGRYHILHGVDLSRCRGPDHDAARPQRRRQDHDAAHHHGTVAGIVGPDHAWPDSASSSSATPDIARLGVGYVPESMAVFSDLTVKENLILAARDGPLDDTAWNGFSDFSRR